MTVTRMVAGLHLPDAGSKVYNAFEVWWNGGASNAAA
jgi:hypothetical protein